MKKSLRELVLKLHAKLGDEFLSQDIDEYVDKLLVNARIISIINQGHLDAFIAFYANDEKRESAFVSLLGVDEKCWGNSYGKVLMAAAIATVKNDGFKFFDAEYLPENKRSVEFIQSFGFLVKFIDGKYILRKTL
jgi:GNAT superfamily N-acetyltransferase